MPKMQQYTVEFKDQSVRFVFESIEPNESREACRRLAPKVNVKEVTLYNWVKAASPVTSGGAARGVVRAATPGPLPTASTIAANSRSASDRLPRGRASPCRQSDRRST